MPRLFKTFLLWLALLPGMAAAQLPAEVAEGLRSAGIPLSNVAVVVQEVGASRPWLTMNSHQPLNPASTMKLVTTYAALELLGPAYRWKTEVYLDGNDVVLNGYGDPKLNLKLEGGEQISVPEIGRVFIVGNIRKPGAFAVQEISDTTVLKVLAMSEGLAPFAAKQAYIYRREGAAGSKTEILIELKKIMDRKSPDVALMANDILYIPDNTGRRTALTALEKILSFGSTAGATALVYRNR